MYSDGKVSVFLIKTREKWSGISFVYKEKLIELVVNFFLCNARIHFMFFLSGFSKFQGMVQLNWGSIL